MSGKRNRAGISPPTKGRRDKGMIEIKLLQLEEDFKPTKDLREKLIVAFKSFMEFHKAETITFRKVIPDTLKIDDFHL